MINNVTNWLTNETYNLHVRWYSEFSPTNIVFTNSTVFMCFSMQNNMETNLIDTNSGGYTGFFIINGYKMIREYWIRPPN